MLLYIINNVTKKKAPKANKNKIRKNYNLHQLVKQLYVHTATTKIGKNITLLINIWLNVENEIAEENTNKKKKTTAVSHMNIVAVLCA